MTDLKNDDQSNKLEAHFVIFAYTPYYMFYSIVMQLLMLIQHPTTPITLQEAINNKSVQVTVVSNPKGTHYVLPVIIQIKNLTGSPMDVLVENGRTFTPIDTTLQPILVIQEELISLGAGQTQSVPLAGMCFNASKHAPKASETASYTIQPVDKGKLGKLAKFLQDNKISSIGAQYAIWCISNNEPLDGIVDWQDTRTNSLVKYVSELTGRPIPKPAPKDDYQRNLNVPPREEVQVGGNFGYTLLKPMEIHIAMFDANGIVARELFYHEAQPKGDYSFDYLFDATVYKDPVYYIRYMENKEVMMEFKLDF